jgi:hypothetical protein
MRRPPFSGDQLDRPYGDQETDYVTIEPEIATAEGSEPTADLEADQEALAAAEARAIGGAPTSDDTGAPDFDLDGSDPAFDPVAQGGGGQAEGFEQSEALLVEHAEQAPEPELTADGFDLADPGTDVDPDVSDVVGKDLSDLDRGDGTLAQPRDLEALRATGEPGEPDEVHSSEITFDPTEGPDDPGRGPGLAFER